MTVVNIIAIILVLIGAVNWGLYGVFRFNLVSAVCGAERNIGTMVIYSLVFLAGIWLIIAAFVQGGIVL